MITRGTTPTLIFTINDASGKAFNLTGYTCYLTFKSQSSLSTFTNDRLTLESNTISLTLTQEETLKFKGSFSVQVRLIKDDVAYATDIDTVSIEDILKDGVIK